MSKIKIQIKNAAGLWVTVQSSADQEQLINSSMDSVQKNFKKDVRAIDSKGALVQLLPYIKT